MYVDDIELIVGNGFAKVRSVMRKKKELCGV